LPRKALINRTQDRGTSRSDDRVNDVYDATVSDGDVRPSELAKEVPPRAKLVEYDRITESPTIVERTLEGKGELPAADRINRSVVGARGVSVHCSPYVCTCYVESHGVFVRLGQDCVVERGL